MFNLNATGRLTADPTVSFHNDTALCEFSIATNRYRGKNADPVTDYIDVTVWGKIAESHGKNLAKGSLVAVNGELIQDRWEQDGTKRSKHVLNANQVEYLAKASNGQTSEAPANQEEPF